MSGFLMWFMIMFPLVYSPGPGNALLAANGAKFGFRQSLPLLAGIDVCFVLQSLITGFGLATVLQTNPYVFQLLRWGGIAYIVYLGFLFLRAAAKEGNDHMECMSFMNGILFTMVNPKAWVMQLMMFSQFLPQGEGSTLMVFKLTAMLCILNITGHVVWVLFGSALLARSSGVLTQRMQNVLYAAMLFGSVYFLV